MANEQNETPKVLPGKKEMKQQLADRIQTALPELRAMLGDKKFDNRIKKAAKLLMEGLHKQEVAEKKKQQPSKANTKKTASKGTTAKKVVVKKAAIKKTAAKKAAVKATKKAKTGK